MKATGAFETFHPFSAAVGKRIDSRCLPGRHRFELAPGDPKDSLVPAKPKVALIIFENLGDDLIGQPVSAAEGRELAGGQSAQAVARPDPQHTLGIAPERPNKVARQPVAPRVSRKAGSGFVVTLQPCATGSNPQWSVDFLDQ